MNITNLLRPLFSSAIKEPSGAGGVFGVLGKIITGLGNVIRFIIGFFMNHWLLAIIFIGLILLLVAFISHSKPKRQAKKQYRKSEKVYNKAYRKEAKQQAQVAKRDMQDLMYTCNQIINTLDAMIPLQQDNTNLVDLRNRYYAFWKQLRDGNPIRDTPQTLLNIYLESYNDTQSELYGQMETLIQQYDYIFGPTY